MPLFLCALKALGIPFSFNLISDITGSNQHMEIFKVSDHTGRQQFLDTARIIYKDDPIWACPLDSMVAGVFDPDKNNFFAQGEAARWVLKENGKLCGRIAAFYRRDKAFKYEVPTGGMGFFECINNQQAADLLFGEAKNWLLEKGMKAADAPINFGENDSFWGLQLEGFEDPSFGMNYNPVYYKELFESAGFVKDYDQITNILDAHKPFPERFTKIARWVSKKPGYRLEPLDMKKFKAYAADFKEIYNDAWKDFENFTPLGDETIQKTFLELKPIMDPNLIWFAYINDEPVSFLLVIPDANTWFKPLKGKLDLMGKLRFLYYRHTRKANRMRAIVMGTKSAYQKHGLESALFVSIKDYVLPLKQYDEMELSWVGDFNTKMMELHQAMEPVKGKLHRTYRIDF